jgi:MEMO1 family protein
MLRLPAVAGKFYPASPQEISRQIHDFVGDTEPALRVSCRACLVPHAGYIYSGHVAGAVYRRIAFPKRVIVLGVRHFPYGAEAAINGSGAWRTPLGDLPIAVDLAARIARACPMLVEDSIAHEAEHSLEVQLPFLQLLAPGSTFVPIALGISDFAEMAAVGQGLATVLAAETELLLLTTSDFSHYENDLTSRRKDRLAIEKILELDARGLFEICRKEKISMCGLGPTVAMLTALKLVGANCSELVRYATSGDVTGDRSAVVGYAGILFR